ncbi:PAS domain S-box protein [Microvirga sp. STS02]|uniref:PAS domain S-box protein n=1 Tax=Hymenobacter negativus TaxID=2795026 RepID=UPI0018DDE408|nr:MULTISPECIES: PAS domain S-box protein [Bacteria]MBH8567288.1 PAS domain S-box protein [Hymenobacter negativus]MBR7207020.1 PAS domain S-box protein [Microvirga sp. STS02]
MPAAPQSDADWAALVAAERARREQAEAALAVAQAQAAALEAQLAAAAVGAQRYYTQLTALVQHLPAGLVLVDHAGQIQFVNQQFWDLFGLPPVAGPLEAEPPIPYSAVYIDNRFADPAAFTARARALNAAGQTALHEVFRLADGRMVELDYLVLDTVGAGRLICYRDVTERHQRDAEIRTLSFIPQQTPNPILRLTSAGEVIYANPAAQPLLQALAADAQGHLPQRLYALVQAALCVPEHQQQELPVDGQHYLCTAVAGPDQETVTLYLTNITARQLAERQLAEQRTFYESILEQVPTAVAVFDTLHRYLFVNPVVEPDPALRAWMLGQTSEAASKYRGRPAAIIEQRTAAFAKALHTWAEVTWEETYPGPQYLLRSYRPVQGHDGTPLVIASGTDITASKQAEQEIARQQEFYESILNLLPVDVAVFDAEHRFLFVNPSSISDPAVRRQIVGLTNDEYFALRRQRHPTGVDQQRNQYFDLAVRTGQDVTWEEMRTGPNRRPQLMLRHLRPVFGADGALRLVVGSGIDITARYQAEKLQQEVQTMLQEQQDFIRQIVDTLPNVIYLVSAEGGVSFSNRAYNNAVLQARHQQPGVDDPTVLKERDQVRGLNQRVQDTRQALTVDLPFTQISGEILYFQVHKRPMLRADGQVDVLTISTDITAVKQARNELERREKQYHDLVHYSQALICTHDLSGKLLSVNPAIEHLMGVPAAQLVGRDLREVLPPEHQATVQAYLNGDEASLPQPRVISIRTRAGERRYLNYYTYKVTEEGYPPYVVASGYDVTPGVLAQRALEHAKQEAEENARAKEAFLARMSHEIRTPLNGMLGMAALLHKTALTAPQLDYLGAMQEAGQHLLALVNDVLDMAKITTHHLELNHGPFDVAVAMQGAGQMVATLAAQKGLALHVEPPRTAVPRVVGDAYRLHQVLLNLLSNAIKFTELGHVRLGAEVRRDAPQELVLRFWVEDTGIGIAPEEQAHIFDAFSQASAETSLRFGGTGLGLAISQQLVEHMGGTLRLSSAPDAGTTFSFQLALPRAPEPGVLLAPAPSDASYEALRGLRVLLAEDNLVNQRIAVVVLEYWGVQVQAVGNGLDALAALQAQSFDAALLDIRMPGLSGVEVTQAIRRHPDAARANLPIIALTANAFAADRAAYLAAGMNACLTKPYEETALCQLLLDLTNAN